MLIIDRFELSRIRRILKQVNSYADQMAAMTDGQLKDQTRKFKARLAKGETLDDLLPEDFATVREADKRLFGMFPFDVQVMGAIALHQGAVAEMKTGEGKTLTATLPIYLNALSGEGAMLITPNEYLARRDGEEMGVVYQWLGLTVAVGFPKTSDKEWKPAQKRAVYNSDVIYTTNGTIGFDYLIDNLASDEEHKYMRPFNYAIVDEADAVLLDSAVTPLVISGAPRVSSTFIGVADEIIYTLIRDVDYEMDEEEDNVWLTNQGIDKIENFMQIDDLFDGHHKDQVRSIELALKAHFLFEKDEDYVINQDNEVSLMDKGNGRVMQGMKLQAGQHQAIEMKEQVDVTDDTRAMATITYQNLFRMFKKLSGMTGTGKVANQEFIESYFMKVIQIPTCKPVIRKDYPDQIYTTLPEKLQASLEEVKQIHALGRPILLVTATVELSEIYSELLLREHIPHSVLNARNAAKEAMIIKEAGQLGAVTVATNMAGRGTDIKLGPGVKELGGLAVIGTEKMASKRIDQQLRGRAGRQGDPGSSKFFISLEDEVVIKYGAHWVHRYYDRHESKRSMNAPKRLRRGKFRRVINYAQEDSDASGAQQRAQSLEMDASSQIQRELVYQQRNDIIFGEGQVDFDPEQLFRDEFNLFFTEHQPLTMDQLDRYILDNITYQYFDAPQGIDLANRKQIVDFLMQLADEEMTAKKQEFATEEEQDRFIRLSLLKAIDECWIDEVDGLEQLRQIVVARQFAQRQPTFEYHKEAERAYRQMKKEIRHMVLRYLLLSTIITDKKGKKDIYYV